MRFPLWACLPGLTAGFKGQAYELPSYPVMRGGPSGEQPIDDNM